jgi:outer membrane protein TolC
MPISRELCSSTYAAHLCQYLQAKAVLQLAKDNLDYYDHVLEISRDRFEAGDIAQIDLDRLELQRVQYESDLQTADVNLRTAKIQLLTLLNDRTPIEQFDVSGPYDFSDQLASRDEVRKIAMDTRPDLKAAVEASIKHKPITNWRWRMVRPTRLSAPGIRTTLPPITRLP